MEKLILIIIIIACSFCRILHYQEEVGSDNGFCLEHLWETQESIFGFVLRLGGYHIQSVMLSRFFLTDFRLPGFILLYDWLLLLHLT